MKKILVLFSFLLVAAMSFAQFTDTAQLNTFIRDTIKDRRPEKVTAAQLQKALLGLSNFSTKKYYNGVRASTNLDSVSLGGNMPNIIRLRVPNYRRLNAASSVFGIDNTFPDSSIYGASDNVPYSQGSTYAPAMLRVSGVFQESWGDTLGLQYGGGVLSNVRMTFDTVSTRFAAGNKMVQIPIQGFYGRGQVYFPRDTVDWWAGRDGANGTVFQGDLDLGNYQGYNVNIYPNFTGYPISVYKSTIDLIREVDQTRRKKMTGPITNYLAGWKGHQTTINGSTLEVGNHWGYIADYTSFGTVTPTIGSSTTKDKILRVARMDSAIGFISIPKRTNTNEVVNGYGFMQLGTDDLSWYQGKIKIGGSWPLYDEFTETLKVIGTVGADTVRVNTMPITDSSKAVANTELLRQYYDRILSGRKIAGVDWEVQSSTGLDLVWENIAYGNGLFVATSSSGTGSRVATSPDGVKWTLRTTPQNNPWEGVTYGNGLFVAVSYSGTNRVMTSSDGITWTVRVAANTNQWRRVTYGNGLFVAVATSGTGNRVMTSPDGINWTAQTSAGDLTWRDVTYGNGLFVAVSNSLNGSDIMTSPDGITWTARTAPSLSSWNSVTYGNGIFVAVAYGGVDRVMTSPDGITWAITAPSEVSGWTNVVYGNGLFVALSTSGTNKIMTSHNGIIWIGRYSPHTNSMSKTAYGNGMFVSVSYDGTGNRFMKSGYLLSSSEQYNNTYQGDHTFTGSINVGKINIPTGTNKSIGTATLVSGTVTVTTNQVKTGSKIFVSYNTTSGTVGSLSTPDASIVNATSFVINSSSGTDASTVNWWIVN